MNERCDVASEIREVLRRRQLVSLAPNDPELRLDLAMVLLKHGRREEAVVEFRAAIALAPDHLDARKLLERVLM